MGAPRKGWMLLHFASCCCPLPKWQRSTRKQLVSCHRFWPSATEGFPASEVTYSASSSTAFSSAASLRPTLLSNDTSLFFSQLILLASIPSCGKWWRIFNKLAQQIRKTVRKQKTIICSWKDLEALLWSCCPDLNSLLQSQDPASYKRHWFYFFMHLSQSHFVKCQVDLFIHNPSWCSGWQRGVVVGWRGWF